MRDKKEQKYIPAFLPPSVPKDDAWVLAFMGKKLIIRKSKDIFYIPKAREIENIAAKDRVMMFIGTYDGIECYCSKLDETLELSQDLELVELREITKLTGDPGLFLLAGTANQHLYWDNVNQYCGCCGSKTEDKKDERAKICPKCNNIVYPRISPATITAVFKGDQILLAHNRKFREGMYSLVAGYVEPGETLEQCVEREIQEEVGIKVKNIQYFTSQPWPFPDSMMMAFTAEYESGEIKVDNVEIIDAGWYQADQLPEIPSTDSVAGKIIRWYRDQKN